MENGLAVYGQFIKSIKDLIYRRQYEALKKVNTELIQLYWEIGGEIDRKQREQGWGKSVVEILAKELQKEFPGVQGFSARNLWRMRNFFVEYSQKTILPPNGGRITRVKSAPTGCRFTGIKSRTNGARFRQAGFIANIDGNWGNEE
jgi:hypothetical protein